MQRNVRETGKRTFRKCNFIAYFKRQTKISKKGGLTQSDYNYAKEIFTKTTIPNLCAILTNPGVRLEYKTLARKILEEKQNES